MNAEYGSLSLTQQSKLMQRIDELETVDDEIAGVYESEIRQFIDMLVQFTYITPAARTRYLNGLEAAKKRRADKCLRK